MVRRVPAGPKWAENGSQGVPRVWRGSVGTPKTSGRNRGQSPKWVIFSDFDVKNH